MRTPKLALSFANTLNAPGSGQPAPDTPQPNLHPGFRSSPVNDAVVPARPDFWRKPFLNLVCDYFKCGEKKYARTVFTRCLKPNTAWMARIGYLLWPSWFEIDMIALNNLAKASNESEFQQGLREYQRLCGVYHNSWRMRLNIRLSCRELNVLKDTLLGKSARNRMRQKKQPDQNG